PTSSSDPTTRLPDAGLLHTLHDPSLRDVPQAILHITTNAFSPIPAQRSGISSTRTAEILNFRRALPPLASVAHVQALLNAPTSVAREIAELSAKGVIRKIVVPGRGGAGELLILVRDLEALVNGSAALEEGVKETYIKLLREQPTSLKVLRGSLSQDAAKQLMRAGFITSATPTWTAADVFSAPGEGARGTLTSLTSIATAARGVGGKVGSEGVVHAAGGSGGRATSGSGSGGGSGEFRDDGGGVEGAVGGRGGAGREGGGGEEGTRGTLGSAEGEDEVVEGVLGGGVWVGA
ncbi:hypothetical protein O988_06659, partial [Pseudogymnoascus sp. VKM F-3808]